MQNADVIAAIPRDVEQGVVIKVMQTKLGEDGLGYGHGDSQRAKSAQMRLVLSATMSVAPEPRNGSRTISSRLVTSRMASSSMAIGLTVGWSVKPQGKSDSFASHLHKNASCHLAVAMTYSELSNLRVEEIDSVSEV